MTTNQAVTPFVYDNSLVRTITLENGDPCFYAMDVAKVLEHTNVTMMVQNLDDDEKGVSKVYTPGGMQEIIILTESGLYTVLIRSNKPQAKPFRRWVTHEVIPQIRKTGGYRVSELEKRLLRLLDQLEDNMVKKEILPLPELDLSWLETEKWYSIREVYEQMALNISMNMFSRLLTKTVKNQKLTIHRRNIGNVKKFILF